MVKDSLGEKAPALLVCSEPQRVVVGRPPPSPGPTPMLEVPGTGRSAVMVRIAPWLPFSDGTVYKMVISASYDASVAVDAPYAGIT
jgi:hypothetical protein